MSSCAYTADQIRAAERPLLQAQTFDDELMQQAARAVATAAEAMASEGRVLLLVGKGGNGGDALYAGATLVLSGHQVDAWLVFGTAQQRALAAFERAGGRVLESFADDYELVIDGVLGIGGAGDLRDDIYAATRGRAVLSVDVPSGISADTGQRGRNHLTADVTVTFGGWRCAHALAPECGVALLADIGIGQQRLGEELKAFEGTPIYRAAAPDTTWPKGLMPLEPATVADPEPGFYDDKYTGGVVGIRAGSGTFPGAALLSVAGAVTATPAMVRYVGPQALEVVRAHPEVVVTESLESASRVQAWVFGPGAGTDPHAAQELEWILKQNVPVLVDADGLSLLNTSESLRALVRDRQHQTVLTPHDGEFHRLQKALGLGETERFTDTITLAEALNCAVVRKGRATIIGLRDGTAQVVDAGSSWAATPGSGDVLAGVIGARMAHAPNDLAASVSVHAMAAYLAAQTPFGAAQTSASEVAAHIRAATAKLSHKN